MATIRNPSKLQPVAQTPDVLRVLAEEWLVLVDAVLHPGRIVDEVQQVRALLVEADRLEEQDPAQAAILRRRAARIGTR